MRIRLSLLFALLLAGCGAETSKSPADIGIEPDDIDEGAGSAESANDAPRMLPQLAAGDGRSEISGQGGPQADSGDEPAAGSGGSPDAESDGMGQASAGTDSSGSGGTGGGTSSGIGSEAGTDTGASGGGPSPDDLDDDGIPNWQDRCPIGPDDDADGDGHPDLCDQVLWSAQIAVATKWVDDASSNIMIQGSLGVPGDFYVTFDAEHVAGQYSRPVAMEPNAEAVLSNGGLWRGAARIDAITYSAGVSGQGWSAEAPTVDMRGYTLGRFVLIVEPYSEARKNNGTEITLGGRWEIRGYEE